MANSTILEKKFIPHLPASILGIVINCGFIKKYHFVMLIVTRLHILKTALSVALFSMARRRSGRARQGLPERLAFC
jgi:hypothetical protein